MKAVPCGWTTRAMARPAAPRTTNSVGRLVFGLSSKCCRSATSKRRGHECCPSSTGSRRWRWGCWRDSSGSSSSGKRSHCTTSRVGCFSPPPTGCCLLTSEPSLHVSFFCRRCSKKKSSQIAGMRLPKVHARLTSALDAFYLISVERARLLAGGGGCV
jgi:hypothetical protein